MAEFGEIERAERFSGRRGTLAIIYTLLFVIYGGIWWMNLDAVTTDGHHLPRIGYAVIWALWGVSLLMLTFGPVGQRWTKRQRAILNDELARAHQAVAARVGFATAICGLAVLYTLMLASVPDPIVGIPIALTVVVAAPALTFAWLQRRDD